MNTAIVDYLASLEFPTLIAENTSEECFNNFRQEYNFVLQSLLPEQPRLSEKPKENQYLIVALLKTLAERESLLRQDINQLLYLLLPSPLTQGKQVARKSRYLDEIIALFGMERKSTLNAEQAFTPSLPESDEAIKLRLASRLGILNNAGTESYYKHHFLSLDSTIQDVLITVEAANTGELKIYLLEKIPRSETGDWLNHIQTLSDKKTINPVADSFTLAPATPCYYQFLMDDQENKDKKDALKINKLIKAYADKKYRFNSVISSAEFYSYLEEASLDNLQLSLYRCDLNKEKINGPESKIECKLGEVPCLVEDTENNSL